MKAALLTILAGAGLAVGLSKLMRQEPEAAIPARAPRAPKRPTITGTAPQEGTEPAPVVP